MNALTSTNFNFKGQTNVYHGKVRDVYSIGNDILVMIATDRISAFDVVLPEGIPYKGQMLNQIKQIESYKRWYNKTVRKCKNCGNACIITTQGEKL